ncbi:MAG: hypothetical protein ACRDI2_11965, partial [Chloroflexota bacterium]
MSATLSRRYGQLIHFRPLAGLPPDERLALARLTYERRTEFEDLPERYQQLILEAEATAQRYAAAMAAGDERTVEEINLQALGLNEPTRRQKVAPSRRRPGRDHRAADAAQLATQKDLEQCEA